MLLAAIRPDAWELPLFLHVLGALLFVGAISTAAFYLFSARRNGSATHARAGFRTLLYGAIPSYLVMRIAAQWVASKEDLEDSEAAWIEIGYIVSEPGLLLLIGAMVAAGIAARRAEGSLGAGPGVAAWLLSALLVAYTVAVWAMTTKPLAGEHVAAKRRLAGRATKRPDTGRFVAPHRDRRVRRPLAGEPQPSSRGRP